MGEFDRKAIKYVGDKERKRDTVAGTGLVWEKDDVFSVPLRQAEKLLKYGDVWQEATTKAEKESAEDKLSDVPDVPEKTILGMSRADLKKFCKAYNVEAEESKDLDEYRRNVLHKLRVNMAA